MIDVDRGVGHALLVELLLDDPLAVLDHEVLDGEAMDAWLERVTRADELAEPPTGELMSVS